MSTSSIKIQDLDSLRKIITDYSPESEKNKLKLLRDFSIRSIHKPGLMLKYQELLLFLAAYPESQDLMFSANSELERLNRISKNILQDAKETNTISFSGSGFASSYFIGSFSYAICTWLARYFPECIAFHSYGDSERLSQEYLGLSLFPSEIWLQENLDLPVKKWIQEASGLTESKSLAWVLQAMKHEELPVSVRDLLFDSLQLYISFDLSDKKNALSLLRTPKGKYFFNNTPLLKRISINEILKKKTDPPLGLSTEEISEYIRIARFALLHLSRETDPVSYCQLNSVEVFDLDRGFSIALYYLPTERRNALDSYVGYMIFKNRIPCGYGGGWIFGEKSKIGLNIFSSFRGGESAFLFSQILRLYKNRFHIRYFEAEPYQIGMDNPEGIASGAFWFYYKLGFRPHQKDLKELALEEFRKINTDRTYRTSPLILKKLAHSMMFLDTLKPEQELKYLIPDSINISQQISALMAQIFHGDRNKAITFFQKEVKAKTGIHSATFKNSAEKVMYTSLLPLLYILCQKKKINKNEINLLVNLVRSKAEGTEYNYTQRTRQIQEWLVLAMKITDIKLSREMSTIQSH